MKVLFSLATLTHELVVARAEASFESVSAEAAVAVEAADEGSAELPSLTPPPPPQAASTAAVRSAKLNSRGGRRVDATVERMGELVMSVSQAKVGYYRSENRRSFSAGSEEPTRSV